MAYTWDKANANASTRHRTQYFEMLGNRAIYHDGWVAATTPVTLPWELSSKPAPDVITGYKWELYNVDGRSRRRTTTSRRRCLTSCKQMQNMFYLEAAKYNVLPLDNTTLARWNAPQPSLTAGRTEFTYSRHAEPACRGSTRAAHPEQGRTPSPPKSRSPRAVAEGMIVTQGGRFGGYGLFLSKGVTR